LQDCTGNTISCADQCDAGFTCENEVCVCEQEAVCPPNTCAEIFDCEGTAIPCDCNTDLGFACENDVCVCEPETKCRDAENCGVMNYCGVDYDCGGCEPHFTCTENLCIHNCIETDPCDGQFCGEKTVCDTDYTCECGPLSVCFDGQCGDVECVVSDDCPSNQICDSNFNCGCEDSLVENENGECITDPCLSCGDNTICHTGSVCYCLPGFKNTGGKCAQFTDPIGDQTRDLQLLQTLPEGDSVPLNFKYLPDGGLAYNDPQNRETILRWLASAGKLGVDFTFQVSVKASNGAFGVFLRNQQQKDKSSENDGFGFILSGIGDSPTFAVCYIDRGEKLCSATVPYNFPVNTETLVTVQLRYINGGVDQRVSFKIGDGRKFNTVVKVSDFPATGFVAMYFDPTSAPGPSFSKLSLVSGAAATIAEYGCLTNNEFADVYTQLTGQTNAPARTPGENALCFAE